MNIRISEKDLQKLKEIATATNKSASILAAELLREALPPEGMYMTIRQSKPSTTWVR